MATVVAVVATKVVVVVPVESGTTITVVETTVEARLRRETAWRAGAVR